MLLCPVNKRMSSMRKYVAFGPENIPACSHCWYRGEPRSDDMRDSGGVIVSGHRWCPECGWEWGPALCPEGSVAICPATEAVVSV